MTADDAFKTELEAGVIGQKKQRCWLEAEINALLQKGLKKTLAREVLGLGKCCLMGSPQFFTPAKQVMPQGGKNARE